MNDQFTQLANEWLTAWNSHNLDEIISHYADDIEFYSPLIIKLNNNPEGKISSKDKLRAYFAKGLAAYPDLHFKLHRILIGVRSIVIYYESVNDTMSAEFMEIGGDGKIVAVRAHYCSK